jgi:type I restriction enzyme S subunit
MKSKNKKAELPSGWAFKELIEIANYVDYRGKTPAKQASGIFLITAKNIRKGYIDYSISEEFISKDDYHNVMSRGIPEKGDILITTEAPLGSVAMINREDIALAQRVIKYRTRKGICNNFYLFHYLQSDKFQQILELNSTGSTAKGIKGSLLHKLKVLLPPLPEQRVIANILSTWDTAISLTQNLLAQKEQEKKWLMQELLTGKKRLKGFEGEWKVEVLGKVGKLINGLTYSPEDITNEGTLVLRSSNIQSGQLSLSSTVFVRDELNYNPIQIGDILICVRNGSRDLIGKSIKLDSRSKNNAFGAFMTVYRSDFNDYLIYFFQSDKFLNQVRKNLGATINSINNSDLVKYKIQFPPKEEQTAIAQVLQTADKEIELLKAKLEQQQLQKKGLMQVLLTGKVRVKTENIS